MIPEKYQTLPNHIKQLFEWGSAMKRGYSYREWEDYLHLGFTDADIPALLQLLNDPELEYASTEAYIWVPVYANRILGQLKSVEAIDAIINRTLEAEEDDPTKDEGAVALAMIGKPALPKVAVMLLDSEEEDYARRMAAMALAEVAQYHPELRSEVIEHFRQYLQTPHTDAHVTNGLLASHLIDIKAVELIDEIRSLYANEYADLSIAGDIEDVELELGLREKRLTPRPRYGFPGMGSLNQLAGLGGADTMGQYDNYAMQQPPETYVRETPKVGRNEPCPCGSGKKYKRCCMNK